jgi:hypothetical protein
MWHHAAARRAFYAELRPSAFAQRLDQCLKNRLNTGTDTGRPLFLLPGMGEDEPRLVRLRAACAPGLRIVPIDYGEWPEWIAPGFDFTAMVARIVAATEAEAPDDPILLAGYSLGGKLAVQEGERQAHSRYFAGRAPASGVARV